MDWAMEMTGFGVGLWKGTGLEVTGGSKGLGFGEKALHLSRLVKKAIWPWWEVPCISQPGLPHGSPAPIWPFPSCPPFLGQA